MRFGLFAFAAACLAAAASLPAQAQEANREMNGVWQNERGDIRVKVTPCGGDLCGVIVWSRDNARDVNNPDPAKRIRPLVGVTMMSGIKPAGGGEYSGSLYNIRDGKTYSGKMKFVSAGTISLSGCILGGLLCGSQTWTRAN